VGVDRLLVVDAKPAIIVPGVQDEGEAVVYLRDEFVGFGDVFWW
jgi:hypothetical protein